MSKYTFLEDAPDPTFKIKFERFLFNEERHRRSQSADDWLTFSLIDAQAEQVVAQIHFYICNSVALSPFRAPFGSIEFSDLPTEALLFFLKETEQRLKLIGVKEIIVKDLAHQYRPQHAALLNVVLLNQGFSISYAEVNSAIVMDNANFESKISYAEVKRLKRSIQEQLDFRVLPMENLKEIYFFIQSCRKERRMSLSMTLSQLESTMQKCPGDFLLFGTFQKEKLIAASISVKVNERILYDFYHAHPKSSDQLSPVVALVNGMYKYCQQNKFELLDLGTSMVDGGINFSLLNFKGQLGGQRSMKLTFKKDLI